ncbi:16S rRNA (guanine(527)-N(7))-methyltransferase RsmG [Malacoplasma iowae]|uniref:Ribosomal RNA small subunit methyltransferase G n=1 Tax=Malacoplasma iowae DK-CPA TaxID=1394179 RepID=A0A084U457_MALIO|nr:16S rRNA (guanine(527)-N(7))-methyltransferase RsmG [Malacoplasma iowae]KFB07743.1 16S rRNA (guanine(527)-N(7))-methyltransferase GidB [Malacoplasma iowae DK-CPA]WPL36442.1 16S rRNA (guanine(527)-N(7))-methyltransferase RsmG [Malacoplasma iowae]WPL38395.1 16S rRNA (guanine(527)-N(7))-methyltransferase RsmG [Malacoplasma iowae]WPL38603.1 16S rRNA (guanine(527)-N(7))-methyltransferase RsmG [Malacoplasma iowae]WPL40367.1 16S rRNA (guanine(527)-N(7))-methyltransferase RsmG [Malacoplasma iowae]
MTKELFLNKLKNDFKNIDIDYVSKKIDIYENLLSEYNEKFNLTRLNKKDIIYDQYFYQSIFVYKNVNFQKNIKVLDIGSGSGIPGVVLKILFPNIKLTIIEPIKKKCLFLKTLTTALDYSDVEIINDRAEIYGLKNREIFDIVTCRAVAELKIILELSFPLTKINGTMIFPKSLNYLSELENSQDFLSKIGKYEMKVINEIYQDKQFNTLFFYKHEQTSKIFPRQWKDIIK